MLLSLTGRPPFIIRYIRHSIMSPAVSEREDRISHNIVRFLAWLKKRGAQQRLITFGKNGTGKGSISKGFAGDLPGV
jgi:hypothetical protein